MSKKFASIQNLLASLGGSASVTPAVSPAASDPAPSTQAAAGNEETIVSLVDAQAAVAQAHAAGVAAGTTSERTRTATVLASDSARDNMALAAFCLTETDATAESIIAKLPGMAGISATASVILAPVAAAPAPAAPVAATNALTVDLGETPSVQVGNAGPAAENSTDEWGDFFKGPGANALTEGGNSLGLLN